MPNRIGFRRFIDAKKQITPFKFDPALVSFTAGMSKRNSAGPFAAGVMVQGDAAGTPNVGDNLITPSFSTPVSGNFSPIFDGYQGSVVFWITPEWNGNSGKYRTIFTTQSFNLYVWTNNVMYIACGSDLMGIDVSSWTAGTTYCVVIRWDSKNSLDGTNFASISVNDVHTFGKNAAFASSYTTTLSFNPSVSQAAPNAIIEGFTVYRRPLFDGAYGIDVGNGDEIALIYNAGIGKDPCEITGSFDVTFCLPTDSDTSTALATGAGQAWSHPHSSNLLNDGWLTSFYGGGKSVGGTSLSINCLSASSIDNLMNADFTAEGWFLSAQNATLRTFFEKNNAAAAGWKFELSSTGRVNAIVYGSTTSANYNPAGDVSDGKWHHWAMTFTGAGTKVIAVYKDGVLLGSSSALVGSTVSDAANSLKLSSSTGGQVGWARISNIIRYTANFAPVRVPPSADANTLGQWNMAEGTGTTLANVGTVGSAADGTITNGVWALNNWTDIGTSGDNVSVAFNMVDTKIDCGNHASVQNLADNAMTVEGYFRLDSSVASSYRMFVSKGDGSSTGWIFRHQNANILIASVLCATSNTYVAYVFYPDKKQHHIAFTYDDGGDRKTRLWLDGILVGTGSAGVGNIISDATRALTIGCAYNSLQVLDGTVGWVRISNNIRYTANFIPPARNNPPANDANTVRLFKLNEGTGTTIVDYSTNAQNATLSNGTWNHTRDMATDSPGARVYNWGNVINAPAAGDGIKQILSGTAGSDYVIRALAYSEDSIGQPKLEVYDETNGAVINSITAWGQQDNEVINGTFDTDTDWTKGTGWTIAGGVAHSSGAVGSNNLYNNTISLRTAGKYYLLGATISNYVSGTLVLYAEGIAQIPTISGNGSYQGIVMATQSSAVYVQARTFTGDVDNVFCMAIPDEQHPKPVQLSFELPTIARNGSAADCVSYSVRLLSATAGVVGFNQCELYANAIDNPGLDAGAAAGPFIPYGFTNSSLQAGNSTLESTVVHSAGKSLAYSSGFDSRGIYNSPVPATGNFYAVGFFGFGEGSAGPSLSATSADSISALLQYSTSATTVSTSTKLWKHAKAVYRALNSSKRNYFMGGTGNTGIRYLDDVYAINLDAVSLTPTPASSANSIEGTGIRVDGRDNVYQTVTPVGILTASKGRIKFIVTPRHSSTTAPSFGNTSRTWLQLYGDANNQIVVSEGATLLTLTVITGGVTYSNTGTKPVITAGSNYIVDMTYVSDKAYISFNGAKVVTTSANISFATVPTALYASRSTNQIDAVFSAP